MSLYQQASQSRDPEVAAAGTKLMQLMQPAAVAAAPSNEEEGVGKFLAVIFVLAALSASSGNSSAVDSLQQSTLDLQKGMQKRSVCNYIQQTVPEWHEAALWRGACPIW